MQNASTGAAAQACPVLDRGTSGSVGHLTLKK